MNQEQAINDILEIVSSVKDEMVTHDELDQKLFENRSQIMSHFVKQLAVHAQIKLEY